MAALDKENRKRALLIPERTGVTEGSVHRLYIAARQ